MISSWSRCSTVIHTKHTKSSHHRYCVLIKVKVNHPPVHRIVCVNTSCKGGRSSRPHRELYSAEFSQNLDNDLTGTRSNCFAVSAHTANTARLCAKWMMVSARSQWFLSVYFSVPVFILQFNCIHIYCGRK